MKYLKLFLIIIILTGCIPNATENKSISLVSQLFEINETSIDKLGEVIKFTSSTDGASIAIRYNLDANEIISVYESGVIKIWDVENRTLKNKISTTLSYSRNLTLDEQGKVVVGALQQITIENDLKTKEFLWGVHAWHTNTGDIFSCITHCSVRDKEKVDITWMTGPIGVAITPNGQWVMAYNLKGFEYKDLSYPSYDYPIKFLGFSDDSRLIIGKISFDSKGKNIAIAYQDGKVDIESFPDPIFIIGSQVIEAKSDNNQTPVQALTFSPDDKFLARVFKGQIAVWNLSNWFNKKVWENEFADARSINFDYKGRFLFIATKDELRVIDLVNMKEITRFITPQITNFIVSSDNRMVIWGDKEGTVHVLGYKVIQ